MVKRTAKTKKRGNGQARGGIAPETDFAEPVSLLTAAEKRSVLSALEKQRVGKAPNHAEKRALRKWEVEREEFARWKHYRTIPQKHWRAMSRRAAKVINEQATLYGIPFDGATIDLPRVVRALHEFLARNAARLSASSEDALLYSGGSSEWLERLREEKARLARLQRLEAEGDVMSRAMAHEVLMQMANFLRQAADRLQQKFGPEAHEILDEAIKEHEKWLHERFGPPVGASRERSGATASIGR